MKAAVNEVLYNTFIEMWLEWHACSGQQRRIRLSYIEHVFERHGEGNERLDKHCPLEDREKKRCVA